VIPRATADAWRGKNEEDSVDYPGFGLANAIGTGARLELSLYAVAAPCQDERACRQDGRELESGPARNLPCLPAGHHVLLPGDSGRSREGAPLADGQEES
jgi:hypothetical protein